MDTIFKTVFPNHSFVYFKILLIFPLIFKNLINIETTKK